MKVLDNRCPDDVFFQYTKPVDEWLKTTDNLLYNCFDKQDEFDALETLLYKASLYKSAQLAYEKAGGDYDGLRHLPHVAVNYVPSPDEENGSLVLWFIFKEENNGDTFRIKHECNCGEWGLKTERKKQKAKSNKGWTPANEYKPNTKYVDGKLIGIEEGPKDLSEAKKMATDIFRRVETMFESTNSTRYANHQLMKNYPKTLAEQMYIEEEFDNLHDYGTNEGEDDEEGCFVEKVKNLFMAIYVRVIQDRYGFAIEDFDVEECGGMNVCAYEENTEDGFNFQKNSQPKPKKTKKSPLKHIN